MQIQDYTGTVGIFLSLFTKWIMRLYECDDIIIRDIFKIINNEVC
jgi:hypothetical protein